MAIEGALDDVVATSTQPALGAIRLAWWREALERLDDSPPPAEPRLAAAAAHLLPRGISGEMLAELADSRAARLEEAVDPQRIVRGGERLFAIGGKLLGAPEELLPAAGKLYALGRSARRGDRRAAPAELLASLAGHRFPRSLRPLTGLARLAARDLRRRDMEPEATPGRAAALLSHRLFGTVA
jgi:15-cis-phytoene synthase